MATAQRLTEPAAPYTGGLFETLALIVRTLRDIDARTTRIELQLAQMRDDADAEAEGYAARAVVACPNCDSEDNVPAGADWVCGDCGTNHPRTEEA